jgi:predicted nucleotidyltransferase
MNETLPVASAFREGRSLEEYVAYWKRRRAAQLAANRRLTERARADLSRIVTTLADRYPIRRLILFGSLARGNFAPESDIDLAVEGLPPGDYFTALAEVNRLTSFWVDLKPLEELSPHFRKRVLATGECIYERTVGG